MGKRPLVVLLVIAIFAGCDPGWRYKVRGAVDVRHQRAYPIPETPGVKGTVECSLFAMGLSVQIEIVNSGSDSLSVDPKLLRVSDMNGTDLSKEWVACNGSKSENAVVLNAGQSCRLLGHFQVDPTEGRLVQSPNRDLKQLTISVDGLIRGGNRIPLQILLEWNFEK